MWPFGRLSERTGSAPGQGADGPPGRDAQKDLRRRAGCIWSLLTEPIALVAVSILAVIFGRAYLVRRARRLRSQAQEQRRAERDE